MDLPKQIGGIKVLTIDHQNLVPDTKSSVKPIEPTANVLEEKVKTPTDPPIEYSIYTVNIFAYVPQLDKLTKINVDSAVPVTPIVPTPGSDNSDNKTELWLQYNGLLNVPTPINSDKENKGIVPCRGFEIVYNLPQSTPSEDITYNLYKITFTYKLTAPENDIPNLEGEAIFVRNKDLDPETSRGTITTVRK